MADTPDTSVVTLGEWDGTKLRTVSVLDNGQLAAAGDGRTDIERRLTELARPLCNTCSWQGEWTADWQLALAQATDHAATHEGTA